MKDLRTVFMWIMCVIVLAMPRVLGKLGWSQTVNIEMSNNSEPVPIVTPNQTINWYTDALDPENLNSVTGIVFEGKTPCAPSTGNPSMESEGSCRIQQNASGSYKYDFCTDRISMPNQEYCSNPYTGVLFVGGKTSSNPSELNLVLTMNGHVHNIVEPGDTVKWFDKNMNPQPVQISTMSTWPCTSTPTASVTTCTIKSNLTYLDFSYNCPSGGCNDPTAHVRSSGSGGNSGGTGIKFRYKPKILSFWWLLAPAFLLGFGSCLGWKEIQFRRIKLWHICLTLGSVFLLVIVLGLIWTTL